MKNYYYDYVLALAEERNFTKAAKKLCISQPSLSQCITKVEKELDVSLFNRSTNPIEITEAGRIFIDTAYKIRTLQYDLENKTSDIADFKNSSLTVGMTPYRCSTILPGILKAFTTSMPKVKFHLITGTMQELSNYAQEVSIDIFVSTESYLNKNIFNYKVIAREIILLTVSKSNPINNKLKSYQLSYDDIVNANFDSKKMPIELLSYFKDEPFLLVNTSQHLYKKSVELCRLSKFEPNPFLITANIHIIFNLTLSGLGVSFTPHSFVKYGNLANHPIYYYLDNVNSSRNLIAAYKKNHYLSKPARKFINIMKAVLN